MRFLILLIIGLSAVSPGLAQDTRDAELAASNEQLNATYRHLIRQLAPSDQVRLRAAQRAWIEFRDADCKVEWVDLRGCLMTRTDEREAQLRSTIYFDARGNPVTVPEQAD